MLLLSFNLAIFCMTLTAILFMVFGVVFVATVLFLRIKMVT